MTTGDVLTHPAGAKALYAAPGTDLVLTYPVGGVAQYAAPVAGNLVLTIQPSGLAALQAFPSLFTPASLNLTGWWRLAYPGKAAMDGGAHWVGEASAGSSATHDLTKVVGSNRAPHDGPNLNGLLTADFQITSADELANPTSNAVLFSAAAGSAWFLVFPNTIATHSATLYQNGNLMTDGANAETDFCFTTSGAGLVLFSGGVYKEVVTPCGGSAWHLLQFKWDGVNQKVRVDSGAWVSSLCGPWAVTTPGAMQLGQSFADTRRFEGRMAEIGTSATVISDADFDNIKGYVNARYGLSL